MNHKVLVIGDPHFKTNNVTECQLMTRRLIELAQSEHVDQIICLGDVLDRHETIHVVPLENAIQCLYQLSQIAPLVVLIGNHDRPNNNHFLTGDHPFHALKYWNNTRIVDRVDSETINGARFLYVPYVPPGRFMEAILTHCDEQTMKRMNCIFAHQEFYGVHMGPMISETGDRWADDYPLVVSGHIHEEQVLQPNLIYVGTPMQHAFGEDPNKSVSIFTFDDKGFTRRRIDLGIGKKIVVKSTPEEALEYRPLPNTQIKMIITCTNSDFKTLLKHTRIKALQKAGVKIQWKSVQEYRKVVLEKRIGFRDRMLEKIGMDQELMDIFVKI